MVISTTGRLFQYPLNGIARTEDIKKFKGDNFEQPYYKFVKVRKIFLNGKGLYELKLVQYCFTNSNLPLYNAVPLNMMLTESEEKKRRRLSSLKEDNIDDSYHANGSGKMKKYVVRREKKKKTPNPYKLASARKKISKFEKIFNRINLSKVKESFQELKNNTQKDVFGAKSGNDIYNETNYTMPSFPLSVLKSGLNPQNSISMWVMPQAFKLTNGRSLSMTNIPTTLERPKKKLSKEEYIKRWKQGLNTISNIISRVELSRKKTIWDVLEEMRISKVGIIVRRKSVQEELELKKANKSSSMNEKTEPSTEIDQQVIDKFDLDYEFLDKLEQMRDKGIKHDEYDLVKENKNGGMFYNHENYSFGKEGNSDIEMGYHSDIDRTNSNPSERAGRKLSTSSHGFGKEGNGNNHEQVYFHKNGGAKRVLQQTPGSLRSLDDWDESSVYTLELNSILKDWNVNTRLSDLNSEITLSKWIASSMGESKNSELNYTGKIMNEDIEMMSKEIEQIREHILKNSEFKLSKTYKSPNQTPRRRSMNQQIVSSLRISSSDEGYLEDSD